LVGEPGGGREAGGRPDAGRAASIGDAGQVEQVIQVEQVSRVSQVDQQALLAWGDANLRDLPWRRSRDPWAVLLSEVMAQQTGVDRVIPYWHAFLSRFPDPAACAAAPVADVLRLWAGLGYNRRGVSLHRCAVAIVERHGGVVPADLDALLALPGVGPYTARAVLSFAYEQPVGVVDTNVGRVLARWHGRPLTPAEAQARADDLATRAMRVAPRPGLRLTPGAASEASDVPGASSGGGDGPGPGPASGGRRSSEAGSGAGAAEGGAEVEGDRRGVRDADADADDRSAAGTGTGNRAGAGGGASRAWSWNQTIMELGAVVCGRRHPVCDGCPVKAGCGWHAAGGPGGTAQDPADGSAGVGKGQSRFEGSDRQGRGRLVDALRKGTVAAADLPAVMGWPDDPERARRVAETVVADGLAATDGATLRLP
jgi:A/G-specific adenine glycosylase